LKGVREMQKLIRLIGYAIAVPLVVGPILIVVMLVLAGLTNKSSTVSAQPKPDTSRFCVTYHGHRTCEGDPEPYVDPVIRKWMMGQIHQQNDR
jgi:hypothetical protein